MELAGIQKVRIAVDSAAGGGGATTTSQSINGKILKIVVDYATTDAGTDITLVTASGTQIKQETIYSKSNSCTDVIVYPRVLCTDNAGTGLSTDANAYDYYSINCQLTATVAEAGSALSPAVTIDVYYDSLD